jgi:hypothetical protein
MFTRCFFLHAIETVCKFCENLFSENHILVNGVNDLFPVLSLFSSDLFGIRQVRSTQYIPIYSVIKKDGLIHVDSRSFCLYTDILFAQIGGSNDKFSYSLDAEC